MIIDRSIQAQLPIALSALPNADHQGWFESKSGCDAGNYVVQIGSIKKKKPFEDG